MSQRLTLVSSSDVERINGRIALCRKSSASWRGQGGRNARMARTRRIYERLPTRGIWRWTCRCAYARSGRFAVCSCGSQLRRENGGRRATGCSRGGPGSAASGPRFLPFPWFTAVEGMLKRFKEQPKTPTRCKSHGQAGLRSMNHNNKDTNVVGGLWLGGV